MQLATTANSTIVDPPVFYSNFLIWVTISHRDITVIEDLTDF